MIPQILIISDVSYSFFFLLGMKCSGMAFIREERNLGQDQTKSHVWVAGSTLLCHSVH